MPYPLWDRTPTKINPEIIIKIIIKIKSYPNSSQRNAPIAESNPINAVTIITLTFIKSNPMHSSCSSSSSAGNENTAMVTNGAIRL